ncbi:hypothetical protein PCANC_09629 [Puccinia coronata f. sp. avenae]|uniref:Uncharacterized protein n=1 Tax=Puccinia coronata f. sp. avenae TaxID=200324 RepID=A0A2N5V1P1_9BASI|nr:hypothetical protein PCASD_19321 [Puccinia coronata f. sp. avenae]PLW43920.1 hypothetical protein PCANC_09629 [Puccinia coronata f. sp. avenae]
MRTGVSFTCQCGVESTCQWQAIADVTKYISYNNLPNVADSEHKPRLAKVDIQCGNNFKTFPMVKGWASCTNYGAWQYRCREDSCYVGRDKKALAGKHLYFYECARLGIEELLPRILAVRYKAANVVGAIEIMDENGQEYSCRWVKPTDPGNVRVSCSYCEEHSFPSPIKPQRSEL